MERKLKQIAEKFISIALWIMRTKENTWKAEKLKALLWAVFYIPYRKFSLKRRTKRQVEQQYDQIAGLYIKDNYSEGRSRYCVADGCVEYLSTTTNMKKIRDEINTILQKEHFANVLEVGVGELTSLSAICAHFGNDVRYYGVDLSLNRLHKGISEFENRASATASICKSDAVALPFGDNAFDLVYSRHTLEQIPELYEKVIDEIIRVSRKRILLFEPSFELGSLTQKLRMIHKDYVRGIPKLIANRSANVAFRQPPYLMANSANPLNHTACYDMLVTKDSSNDEVNQSMDLVDFVCPVTKSKLIKRNNYYYSVDAKLAYPIVEDIPILEEDHALYLSVE